MNYDREQLSMIDTIKIMKQFCFSNFPATQHLQLGVRDYSSWMLQRKVGFNGVDEPWNLFQFCYSVTSKNTAREGKEKNWVNMKR